MTIKAADDFENIARRLKELEAERKLIQTGSTADEPIAEQIEKAGEYALGWPTVEPAIIGEYYIFSGSNGVPHSAADYDPA